MNAFFWLALISGYVLCAIVGLLGLIVLWKILDGTINISRLISEPNGDASMSRFQFLVFTFVIAMSLFLVIVGKSPPKLPGVIPGGILALLGISGSSYLVSKGIQFSDPAGVQDRGREVIISPMNPQVRYGSTQQFTAEVPRKPEATIIWELIAGPGALTSKTGSSTTYNAPAAPAAAAAGGAPPAKEFATLRASIDGDPESYDLAVITLC